MPKDVSTLLKGADRDLARQLARDPSSFLIAVRDVQSPVSERLDLAHASMRRLTKDDLAVRVNVTSVADPVASVASPPPQEER